MSEYFTSDHFKLLNRWKGQKRDDSNPEQNRAYEDLKKAYEATEVWANELQQKLFPYGWVEVRKRPTNQANNFAGYTWAKIYPWKDAPKSLAYTVGIDATIGFVVKIDTVKLEDSDPARQAYLSLRGAFDNTSPFVRTLPAADGLSKPLPELVQWSIDAIRSFQLRYMDVARRLNLLEELSDEDLLKHFDGKPAFKTFRASWSLDETVTFCRLARAVHAAGLDWWHGAKAVQVRFGRKNAGSERATGLLGVIRGTRSRKISWMRELGPIMKMHREPLTDDIVKQIESALTAQSKSINDWFPLDSERPGLWPDQLRIDAEELGDDKVDTDDLDEEEELEPAVDHAFIKPFNRIYYGPPGTGKTFELTKILKRDYEQDVSSMSVSEWRKQFIAEKIASLKWWEGAAASIYDLGGQATVSQIVEHPFIQAIASAKGSRNVRATLWASLQTHTVDVSTTVKVKDRVAPAVFDKTAESVWRLVDDWRDSCQDLVELVNELKAGPKDAPPVQRYSLVTFHQSYGYEEFVEGLRPILNGGTESGDIQYEIRSGVFKELCRKARLAPHQRFAMVIDEINRGNISKIFGELITLIELDKRDGGANQIRVTLPYSGESFSVPSNVDIIGTMNTADRSLALLDTALRRRFDFEPLLPDTRDVPGAPLFNLRVTNSGKVIEIPRMLNAINRRIEALYDRDHCIGHAYFMSLKEVSDEEERFVALAQIFRNRIVPLLEEYFFEDWQKIRLVLGDNQKIEAARFIIESGNHEEELAGLFGSDHGLDAYTTRRRYNVQEAAFSTPEAYTGIYETLAGF